MNSILILISVLSYLIIYHNNVVHCLYTGKYQSKLWEMLKNNNPNVVDRSNMKVTFIVALALRNLDHMQSLFLNVSNPQSSSYGNYLSLKEIHNQFSPHKEDTKKIFDFFSSVPNAILKMSEFGDMIEIVMRQSDIEMLLHTELKWFTHTHSITIKKSLRAIKPIVIPLELHSLISFISLNSPINHIHTSANKASSSSNNNNVGLNEKAQQAKNIIIPAKPTISSGNEEALIFFQPFCGRHHLTNNNTSSTTTIDLMTLLINNQNPPCNSSLPTHKPMSYKFVISKHATSVENPILLDNDYIVKEISYSSMYCFDTNTSMTCNEQTTISIHCKCIAKLTNLPKYTQLQVNVYAMYDELIPSSSSSYKQQEEQSLGVTSFFALTDVATPNFLSTLYNIPKGLSVKHGSNQSVAEFYGEFFSNQDLAMFLELSGLPVASIPDSNILGDLKNDRTQPGGEAQLDIEYIMALAPGADTYLYSFSDLNPFDSSNEGFLSYVLVVNGDPYPPLVHSLSYGDIESEVFFDHASSEYGKRCDQEFMKMGLRGLTVVFSSGDDGIADFIIREDPVGACQQANPSWPAGSPYVTSIGATQLTNKYHPACNKHYQVSSRYPELPTINQLDFQCTGTGETVCSSILGGVITSGGGFSNVYSRETTAPWQIKAVNSYLSDKHEAFYPPLSYFNANGRGYPDVSTYGSNYFVYLNGSIIRESGTSASAPVFAAMVTLWNDIRLAYKKPSMGFIAPFLYDIYHATPQAFQDIDTGDNACGVGHSIDTVSCCNYSFAAISGWDAVTGLGSPNFDIISNLVINKATAFPHLDSIQVLSHTMNNNNDDDNNNSNNRSNLIALILSIIAIIVSSTLLIIIIVNFKHFKHDNHLINSNGNSNSEIIDDLPTYNNLNCGSTQYSQLNTA